MQNRTISSLLAAAVLTIAPGLSTAAEYNVVHPFPLTNGITSLNIIPQYIDCFRDRGDKLVVHFKPGADTVVGAKFAVENKYSLITPLTGNDKISSDDLKAIMSGTSYKQVPFSYFNSVVIQANRRVREDTIFVTATYEKGITGFFAKEFVEQRKFKDVTYVWIPSMTERVTYTIANNVDYAVVTESDTLYQQEKEGRFKILDPRYESIMWLLTNDKELENKIKSCSATVKHPPATGIPDQGMVERWNKRFR